MENTKRGYVVVHKDYMDFVECIIKNGEEFQFRLTVNVDNALIFESTYQAFKAIQDVEDSENYEIARYSKTITVDRLNIERQVKDLLEFTDFKDALDSLDGQKFNNFKIKKYEGTE